MTFFGYKRPDGRVGVRNKVADGSTTFTWGAVAGVDHYMLTATAIDGTVLLNIPEIPSTITEYTITGEEKSRLWTARRQSRKNTWQMPAWSAVSPRKRCTDSPCRCC